MHLRLPRPGPAAAGAFAGIGALVTVATVLSTPLQAQIGRAGVTPARPDVYAITNARIVPVSGAAIARGTVVVRDGLIAAVGPSDRVATPADARVVDGSGLTVYPGFIDASTSLGIPAPTPARGGGGPAALLAAFGGGAQQQGAGVSPNSRYPAGLQPEVSAIDLMRIDGDPFDAARGAGFTAALVGPRTGIFAGTSALVSLAPEATQDIVLRSPVALQVGFTPIRGEYPGSLLGVFAALRQMLYDAQRYGELQAAYARNPRGMRRPETDLSLAALLPALRREMPVVMQASSQREIERALDLAKEFNLRAVISGGAEAWRVAARLRAEQVPVIATLDFPGPPQQRDADADPEPLRILRERVDAPKNAGRLAEAGVTFAFTSGGAGMSQVLPGLRRTTREGLARDRALRALTLDAAQILGVAERLGSIETGKIANLTIVRGDVFDSTARVVHVVTDGRMFDVPDAPAAGARGRAAAAGNARGRAAAGNAASPDSATPRAISSPGDAASGQWSVTVTLDGKEHRVTLDLRQQRETLRGSIQGALGASQISNATIDINREFRFTASVTVGETEEAVFAGIIQGPRMRGTVTIVGEEPGTFVGARAGANP